MFEGYQQAREAVLLAEQRSREREAILKGRVALILADKPTLGSVWAIVLSVVAIAAGLIYDLTLLLFATLSLFWKGLLQILAGLWVLCKACNEDVRALYAWVNRRHW